MRCHMIGWLRLTLLLLGSVASGLSQGIITTVVGTDWHFPVTPRPALNAPLGAIQGVAVDGSGNLYVSDGPSNMVFRIAPSGMLTVVAGNGIKGYSGDGGPATAASLNQPSGIAVDSNGNLYISDSLNNRVRKVAGGIIATVAGNGLLAFGGDGGPATNASLFFPTEIAVDGTGNLYIVDTNEQRVRQVSGGIITTVAGNGTFGFSGDGGLATDAALDEPEGVAVDTAGNLFIADARNNRVRKVSGGIITTVAGNGLQGFSGDGGAATNAALNVPFAVAVDAAGNLYINDLRNNRIRKVSGGIITTEAGFSGDEGPATSASLVAGGLAVDLASNVYIADSLNNRVRKVSGGIITTIAGNGGFRFSGDGGAATDASLYQPWGVAVDSNGSLYISDSVNKRVRKVSGGIITTVAGNGTYGFSGDGVPATRASFFDLSGIGVDAAGNLYIVEAATSRIHKVSGGIITTVAGNGFTGFSGDGGPATSASLFNPSAVAVDAAGNLYIADWENFRIRKVSGGTITTIAGNGSFGFSGDGGPATDASLAEPADIAVDAAGNLYIADLQNDRVRKVSNGIITTVAGNGTEGFSGDDGPATNASLNFPSGLAVDAKGDLYIADSLNNRVRKVSSGIITTVAGSGTAGFSGDGGPATSASLSLPFSSGIAVDGAGNLYIADYGNDRIREVLAQRPALQLSTTSLNLVGSSGGKPVTGTVTVFAATGAANSIAVPGMTYTVQIGAGNSWLSVTPQSGNTPGLITVTADPSNLAPGNYSATFTLSVPNANPSVSTVNVQFIVGTAIPANLTVDHNHLSFTYSSTSAARMQTVTASNTGGGSVSFSVAVFENSGQSASWLSVTPTRATATPANPAVLSVKADPSQLPPGTYIGTVTITSAAGSSSVAVVMTISTNPLILLLSQTGLTFTAVQNGGAVPPQTFSVLNLGSGTLNWTAQTSVLGGVNNWLVATPNSGVSNAAASSTAPVVNVSVNPSGLGPGVYYGLVTITSSGAANTPQAVVVVLQVLSAGMEVAPVVQPNSLVFTGTAGNSSPGSQTVQVFDPTGTNKSFRSGIVTVNGGNWLVTLPGDATIPANQPVQVVVQPFVNNLAPGTYQGTLTLQFSDGRVSTVAIQFVVTTGAGGGTSHEQEVRPADSNGPCTSTQLMPSLLTLGPGFSVPAGYPQGLEAQVVDNCGAPQVEGTVFVQFTNGDAPVKLQSVGNGMWDGTWPVGQTAAAVTLTMLAQNAATVQGQSQINGGLAAMMPVPMVASNGVVGLASSATGGPVVVAPGELISIYGQQLSGGQSTVSSGTLPPVLAGTTVAIGSQAAGGNGTFQALPLMFASSGQVNAEVPIETSVNTNQQILLQWGTAYAPPVYVDVAAAAPAILPNGQQGMVADGNGNLIGPMNPAHAGDVVMIYCVGLGAVSPPVQDGSVTPDMPQSTTQNPVTVMIEGQDAAVQGATLTPGYNGVYQVTVTVPQGVVPSDNVPVTITVAGQTSAPATTSVQ